ncbi:MAG: [FeFe] hydrogenase H-cluster radical SAM maturase HydE [Candidatus Aureabacteria bacterium]|nr:[FeFe] hydrogenase H-cluster radical SAM maturase HydE [Candidatus Auribacterota bacterium]
MCYAIPGRVTSFNQETVIIDYFGEEKKAHNDFYELKVGDYVYAQGGFVVKKIPPDEALEILSVWKETFFDLQEIDLRLSRLNLEAQGIPRKTGLILDKLCEGRPASKEELLYFLNLDDPFQIELLGKSANFVRQKNLKNSCCVHGIIEISSHCSQRCSYCGISAHHQSLSRYRMGCEEIYSVAFDAVEKYGFKALVLQSGEDAGYQTEELAGVIRKIREELGALIFISFGEISIDALDEYYQAGARGFLMRFETSNPVLYEKVRPGNHLETRLELLRKAYEAGYLIITGALIGLPGQTPEDILNDIHLANELKTEMLSFGPFIPHPSTPFACEKKPLETDVLKTLAVARLCSDPESKILVTTGFETLTPQARKTGLMAGANSVMLNVTPMQYRKKYCIYPHRAHEDEEIAFQIQETISLLKSLGRAPTDLG